MNIEPINIVSTGSLSVGESAPGTDALNAFCVSYTVPSGKVLLASGESYLEALRSFSLSLSNLIEAGDQRLVALAEVAE